MHSSSVSLFFILFKHSTCDDVYISYIFFLLKGKSLCINHNKYKNKENPRERKDLISADKYYIIMYKVKVYAYMVVIESKHKR